MDARSPHTPTRSHYAATSLPQRYTHPYTRFHHALLPRLACIHLLPCLRVWFVAHPTTAFALYSIHLVLPPLSCLFTTHPSPRAHSLRRPTPSPPPMTGHACRCADGSTWLGFAGTAHSPRLDGVRRHILACLQCGTLISSFCITRRAALTSPVYHDLPTTPSRLLAGSVPDCRWLPHYYRCHRLLCHTAHRAFTLLPLPHRLLRASIALTYTTAPPAACALLPFTPLPPVRLLVVDMVRVVDAQLLPHTRCLRTTRYLPHHPRLYAFPFTTAGPYVQRAYLPAFLFRARSLRVARALLVLLTTSPCLARSNAITLAHWWAVRTLPFAFMRVVHGSRIYARTHYRLPYHTTPTPAASRVTGALYCYRRLILHYAARLPSPTRTNTVQPGRTTATRLLRTMRLYCCQHTPRNVDFTLYTAIPHAPVCGTADVTAHLLPPPDGGTRGPFQPATPTWRGQRVPRYLPHTFAHDVVAHLLAYQRRLYRRTRAASRLKRLTYYLLPHLAPPLPAPSLLWRCAPAYRQLSGAAVWTRFRAQHSVAM